MASVAVPTTPAAEADAAWARLAALGSRARTDRAGALAELDELFCAGRASGGIDGATRGRFVAFALHPVLDRAAAAVARRAMPWSGKRFDAAAARGENLLLGGRLSGFGFQTRVEPGALHPDLEVAVIDYAAVPSNRWFGLHRVRDELVEVAPGVHLGQALWRRRDARPARLAWWALRAS